MTGSSLPGCDRDIEPDRPEELTTEKAANAENRVPSVISVVNSLACG